MNHISAFFNNRIVQRGESHSNFAFLSAKFGEECLTPVRYLFNGHKIIICSSSPPSICDFLECYNKTVLGTLASIILLLPGLIIGSAFKGLGYISSSIRERHQLVVQHHTPVDRTLGSPEKRLNLVEIRQQLDVMKNNNFLLQSTRNLVIYAEEGTQLRDDQITKDDPFLRFMHNILSLSPQKLILIGAQLSPCSSICLNMAMDFNLNWGWERRNTVNKPKNATLLGDNHIDIAQWSVQSIEAALQDIPPKRSFFSSERIRRIYVVNA